MNYDLSIKAKNLTVYCSKSLQEFSKEFVDYYSKSIDGIKNNLGVNDDIKLVVFLTDNIKYANFVYGYSDFSGFFNDNGAFAYVNLNGKQDKCLMIRKVIHELVHHIYLYYVYGEKNERITWADEGIAQLFSGQNEKLNDANLYNDFLSQNLSCVKNFNLNQLNHDDKSFLNDNGYNLSYIAVRYLYETNSLDKFINIISNHDILIEIGSSVLKDACSYYGINSKHI